MVEIKANEDGKSFLVDLAKRVEYRKGEKATIDQLIGLNRWATEMKGVSVSLLIAISKAMVDQDTAKAKWRKEHPPEQTEEVVKKTIADQKTILGEFGFTETQITVLANTRVLGTQETFDRIGEIMKKTERAEECKNALLKLSQG